MAIGARIKKRLEDLEWERSDLLAKLPSLSPQALSNLIRRDSVRSEWDTQIAEALGMHVMELVYGVSPPAWADNKVTSFCAKEPSPAPHGGLPAQIAELAAQLDDNGQRELLGMAKALVRTNPREKKETA